jgi:hypothetical protein
LYRSAATGVKVDRSGEEIDADRGQRAKAKSNQWVDLRPPEADGKSKCESAIGDLEHRGDAEPEEAGSDRHEGRRAATKFSIACR